MKKRAFTLAEVLVTMAVIGVVAAMTIPNMMQDTSVQQLSVKLKKFAASMENAARAAAIDEDLDGNAVMALINKEFILDKDITASVTSANFRDNTGITLDTTATTAGGNGYSATRFGDGVAKITFNPDIKGLEGKDTFDFVVTSRGFVFPASTDTCLVALYNTKYNTKTSYDTSTSGACKKTS